MNVLLLGNSAADQQLSMLGFAGALQSGLCDRGIAARILAPAQVFGRFGRPHAGVGKWLAYVDKFALFPRALRRALAWADVVHVCDQGNAMYLKYLQQTPHVLTCNDLMAIRAARGEMPGWTTGRTGRVYQKLILAGIDQAQHVACISETTRQDLLRISHVPQARASVIPEGLLYPYRPMPTDESAPILSTLGLDAPTPYLLHVGGNQPYKNRDGVLAIYAALRRLTPETPLRLVLAGKPFTDTLRRSVADNAPHRARRRTCGHDQRAVARPLLPRHGPGLPITVRRLRPADHRGPGLRLPRLHVRPRPHDRSRRTGRRLFRPDTARPGRPDHRRQPERRRTYGGGRSPERQDLCHGKDGGRLSRAVPASPE